MHRHFRQSKYQKQTKLQASGIVILCSKENLPDFKVLRGEVFRYVNIFRIVLEFLSVLNFKNDFLIQYFTTFVNKSHKEKGNVT